VTHTATVTNLGPGAEPVTVLTVTLPDGAAPVLAEVSQGNCAASGKVTLGKAPLRGILSTLDGADAPGAGSASAAPDGHDARP
jgi:hypothetical protein